MLQRTILFSLAAAACGIAIRLPFVGRYADSFDAVDFALGIVDFNVFAMQPHFPGYPVLMIMGYLLHLWLNDPVVSLSVLSAVSGGLLSVPVFIMAKRLTYAKAAWIASALTVTNPFLWLYSLQPMSDMPGILFVYISLALLILAITSPKGSRSQWIYAAGSVMVFGLGMGIRLSYFPMAAMFILFFVYLPSSWKGYLTLFLAGILSVGVWLLPTVHHEGGWQAYWEMGTAFTKGHFTEWGGTALDSRASWMERVTTMVGEYWLLTGGAGWMEKILISTWKWLFILLLFFIFCFGFYIQRKHKLFYIIIIFPYLIWVLLGQNVDKPRHMLILVPILMLLLAAVIQWGMDRKQIRWLGHIFLLAVLAVYGTTGWTLAHEYARSLPPAVQLAHYLKQNYEPDRAVIFTWEEERVIEYYEPLYQAERLRSPDYFANRALQESESTAYILATHYVIRGFGAESREFLPHFREIASFRGNPTLYPTYNEIILYEALPSLLPYLKTRE